MFTVQRIYAYQPDSKQTAVFIDRLHLEASQVYIGEYIDGKLVAHRYPS